MSRRPAQIFQYREGGYDPYIQLLTTATLLPHFELNEAVGQFSVEAPCKLHQAAFRQSTDHHGQTTHFSECPQQ